MNIVSSRGPRIFLVLPLQNNLRENILTLKRDDDWYKEVKDFIGKNTMMVPRFEGFTFDDNGLLRFKNQIDVPLNDELRSLILNKTNRAVYMAHLGVEKMREDLKPLVHLERNEGRLSQLCGQISRMQEVKDEHRHPKGLLQPYVIPKLKWEVN
jgi:hypothetical protein